MSWEFILLLYLVNVSFLTFIVVPIPMRLVAGLWLAHGHHLLGALLLEGHLHQGGLGLDGCWGVRDGADIHSHLLCKCDICERNTRRMSNLTLHSNT